MPKKPLFIIGLENRLNNPTFPLAAASHGEGSSLLYPSLPEGEIC